MQNHDFGQKILRNFLTRKVHRGTKAGFKVRAIEHMHQDDWVKHREGPRNSLGAPRKLLGKVTKVTKVTNRKSPGGHRMA